MKRRSPGVSGEVRTVGGLGERRANLKVRTDRIPRLHRQDAHHSALSLSPIGMTRRHHGQSRTLKPSLLPDLLEDEFRHNDFPICAFQQVMKALVGILLAPMYDGRDLAFDERRACRRRKCF